MTGGILGGGVLLGTLILLWVVVLAPGWAKDREFRAAEQNAARIQRTLRVLVETAAVPEEHIVEATARQALAHEKMVRATEEHREALRKAELQKLLAEQKRELRAQRALVRQAKLSNPRLKPIRLLAAAVTVLGVLGMLIGLGFGIAGVGWAVCLTAIILCALGVATLLTLAPRRSVALRQETAVSSAKLSPASTSKPPVPASEQPRVDTRHLEHAKAQAEAARRSEIARAKTRARRATEPPSLLVNQTDLILLKPAADMSTTPKTEPHAPARPAPGRGAPALDVKDRRRQLAVQERLRSMGVIGDTSVGMPDLDEALRRRRNAS